MPCSSNSTVATAVSLPCLWPLGFLVLMTTFTLKQWFSALAAIRITWDTFKKKKTPRPGPTPSPEILIHSVWGGTALGGWGGERERAERDSISARSFHFDMVGLIKLGFVLLMQNKHQILFPLSSPFTGGNENPLTFWWKAEAETVTRKT